MSRRAVESLARARRRPSGARAGHGLQNPWSLGRLSGLTSLTVLALFSNPGIANIQPLLDNPELGAGDIVGLSSPSVNCSDVAALEAKGVTVASDCS